MLDVKNIKMWDTPTQSINNQNQPAINAIDEEMSDDFEDESFGADVAIPETPTTITANFDKGGNLNIQNSRQMAEGDYSQFNQIDDEMDEDLIDDDDDSNLDNIKPIVNQTQNSKDEALLGSEERDYNGHLGVTVDFGNSAPAPKKQVVQEKKQPVSSKQHKMSDIFESDFDEIDPELVLDDEQDENNFDEIDPELVDEDMLDERKGDMIDNAVPTDDYFSRIAKRHKSSNVKGSYNTHFHFSGNPEREKDLMNHDLTPAATPGTSLGGSVPSGGEASGGGEGCGESLKKSRSTKLFENLLFITGFELQPTEDGLYILKDLTDMVPEETCQDQTDALLHLKPYIDDTIITPLQYQTKETFTQPEEWVNWYTPEMQKKFPRCKEDIEYCQMLMDHLKKVNHTVDPNFDTTRR